jgi:hypothetical protein
MLYDHFFVQDKAQLKREPTELIVIETPSAVLAEKALDIADYSGEYEGEEEDSYDYVDYTAEEERLAAQQGKGKYKIQQEISLSK